MARCPQGIKAWLLPPSKQITHSSSSSAPPEVGLPPDAAAACICPETELECVGSVFFTCPVVAVLEVLADLGPEGDVGASEAEGGLMPSVAAAGALAGFELLVVEFGRGGADV